jgi:hypothetical protein
VEALVQQGEEVLVEDLPLPVRQGGEAAVHLGELQVGELVAQLAVAPLQRVTPGVLAEHQRRAGNADHLRPDDLVGEAVLEHPVLMDARLVGEGVAAHDGLVGLGEDAGEVRQELAGAVDLAGLHLAAEAQPGTSHLPGHHDLLQCGVAGPLADAVHRALHLPGAGLDGGERVGDGEAQVVVAVGAQHHPVGTGDAGPDVAEHRGVLVRQRVSDRVGQVDRAGTFGDRQLRHPAEEVGIAPARVLGGEFHVVGVASGPAHGAPHHVEHVVPRGAQFLPDVQIGGGDEHVHPSPRRRPDRLAREIDVPVVAPRQGRDHGPAHFGGDLPHAAVVALGGRGEPRLDDVHAERVELPGESELLLGGETVAGGLLAVAQGGVEDEDVRGCHDALST